MRRRTLIGTIISGLGFVSGCILPSTGGSVALSVENKTNNSQNIELIVGGTVIPDVPTPEGNKTLTPIGREEITFERTISLSPQETRRFEKVMEYTDGPRSTGLTVNVDDRPQRRIPLLNLHTPRNLIILTIHEDEIEVSVTQK
jgi:hypothetical protein